MTDIRVHTYSAAETGIFVNSYLIECEPAGLGRQGVGRPAGRVAQASAGGVRDASPPRPFSADLAVSGRHSGYLKADNVLIQPNAMTGTIESQLDGRHLTLGPLP
ncbi:hypothetical protein AB0L53_42270 [Nonomuraea sp. NPDC052129]|uniref:hypothetical protein n=1 Tax=Nonomuraea sp. NPDC052129 TaxID=3154651 RepID=UPI00341D521B